MLSVALIAVLFACANAAVPHPACDAPAQVESGPVCGVWRRTHDGHEYASFRGVPYAKQPVGELRFKELEPAEPWTVWYATEEGPICPQHDVFYGRLLNNRVQSEACIHANIHVPKDALPGDENKLGSDESSYSEIYNKPGRPILVFIHGGGFAFGSGDSDLHGPERLVREGVIVITFNYRLNVFGFLSLKSTSIPGNNGLRDQITLLKWVQRNARAFGGNPDDVTLAGQSAGAASAHILSLSTAAEGLFKRVIMMSGTAIPSFYTTSPVYAQYVSERLSTGLGINSTNPDDIHRQLVAMPLEKIMAINKDLVDEFGTVVFFPVIETPLPGVTPIIDEDTEVSLAKGKGSDIPILIGYTSDECESFKPRFKEINFLDRLKVNPLLILSPSVIFSMPPETALLRAKRVEQRYFRDVPTFDDYMKACSDTFFKYPPLKVAEYRQKTGGAPAFMYEFAYRPDYSVIKEAMGIHYNGSAHVEDLTFVFQVNSVKVPNSCNDSQMSKWMTKVVTNFMRYSQPTSNPENYSWPSIDKECILYEFIESSTEHYSRPLTAQQRDMMHFFDSILSTTSS